MRPKWIWFVGGGVALVLVVAVLCAKPLVRRGIEREARERGVEFAAEDVSLSFGEVTLRDARLTLPDVPGVRAELREVRVAIGFFGRTVRGVDVDGGRVLVEGTVDEVRARVDAFRARRRAAASGDERASSSRPLRVRGLDVIWKGAFEASGEQKLAGVSIERTADRTRIGVDLATITRGGTSLGVAGSEFVLGTAESGALVVETVRVADVRLGIRAALPAPVPAAKKDDAKDASQREDDAKDTSEREDDAEKADGLLAWFERSPERETRVRAALALVRSQLDRLPLSSEVSRLTIEYERGPEKLHTGPHRLTAKRAADGASIEMRPGLEARGTPLSFRVDVPRAAEKSVTAEIEGGPVALASLGVREGDLGLTEVNRATIAGKARAVLSADAKKLAVEGRMTLEGLVVSSDRLAPEAVRFPSLQVGGRGELSLDGSRTEVEEAELKLGDARFVGKLAAEREPDHLGLDFAFEAPLASCQALVDSAPVGLLGAVANVSWSGTLSLGLKVKADTRQLAKMQVGFDFESDCRAKSVPQELDPSRFTEPFQLEVMGVGDVPETRDFGPRSPNWTSRDEIPMAFETALLVTEDGRFLRHPGYDVRAIESSIRDNVRAGRFLRGASTISMQLAKNLYLTREKNLARKLQELALTLLLEQSFAKTELLELYANVIELGPGIYGIRQAAAHYFQKTPDTLTTMQCFFLASILPSPTDSYFDADGKLRARRKEHLDRLVRIAAQRDRLTQAEVDAALAEELVFGRPETTPSAGGAFDWPVEGGAR